jgi:uncharacterized oxidoreductase
MPVFGADELRKVVYDVFSALGASSDEVHRLQEHLVGNNLIGYDSHGVRVIPLYVELVRKGDIVFRAELEMVCEGPCHAMLDGNWGLGQLMGWKAAQLAADKAQDSALVAVTLRNCSHLGRLGEYSQFIAEQGLVGFVTVNGHGGAQLVAPWAGLERRLSVNPFSYAIPGPEIPVVVDISPTVVAGGKVAIKSLRQEAIPEGWVMDGEGRATTSPDAFDGPPPGSLLPLGGHKGFAMGLVMDILAGALSGGGCSGPNPERWGNATFILAINPAFFGGQQEFEAEVRDFLAYVRSSRLAPGFKEILIPGEPEVTEKARRSKEGIFVGERTWGRITAVLDELTGPDS